MTEPDLGGQVALVTGGGRGIGRATALALAEAGASVAVCARTGEEVEETADAARAMGVGSLAGPVDVTDEAAVRAFVGRVEAELGPIGFLVNNAAAGTVSGPIAEADQEAWWRCLEVNVRGPMLCVQAALPQMITRGMGRIVTLASGAGLAPVPNLSAYAISKTAVIRFTEILAREVAESGISAFSVDLGTVRTAMAENLLDSEEGRRWLPWFGSIFERNQDVPPEAAAELIVCLASGRADDLSGCMLSVEDDLDEMVTNAEAIVESSHYRLRFSKP